MNKYKYPYIPKEYYAATMFACKMIRENGYFNRAIEIASRYYDVDSEELKYHVNARKNAGENKHNKGKKLKYFVVERVAETCEGSDFNCYYTIRRKFSKKSLQKELNLEDKKETITKDTGSYYSPSYYSYILVQCDDEVSAISKLAKIETLECARPLGRMDSITLEELIK